MRTKACSLTLSTGEQASTNRTGEREPVGIVRWSPDGRWLLSCGKLNNQIRLWDAKSGEELHSETVGSQPTTAVAFHPSEVSPLSSHHQTVFILILLPCLTNQFIMATAAGRQVCYWDLTKLAKLGTSESGKCIQALAFSPDGDAVVCVNHQTCQVFALKSRKLQAETALEQAAADLVVLRNQRVLVASVQPSGAVALQMLKLNESASWPPFEAASQTPVNRTVIVPLPVVEDKENNSPARTPRADIGDFTSGSVQDTDEFANELAQAHGELYAVLNRRVTESARIKAIWSRGDLLGAIGAIRRSSEAVVMMGDVLATADITAFSAEAVAAMCPILQEMLSSKYEEFQIRALDAVVRVAEANWASWKRSGKGSTEAATVEALTRLRAGFSLASDKYPRLAALSQQALKVTV